MQIKRQMGITTHQSGSEKTILISGTVEKTAVLELGHHLRDFKSFVSITLDLTAAVRVASAFVDLLLNLKTNNPGTYRRIRLLNPNNNVQKSLSVAFIDRIYSVQNQVS